MDRLPTLVNLRLRDVNVHGLGSPCYFYQEQEENMEHMFFTCKFDSRVWNECYSWFQLSLAQHRDCFKHFYQHDSEWLGAMKKNMEVFLVCNCVDLMGT